jgi:hypothetical protein
MLRLDKFWDLIVPATNRTNWWVQFENIAAWHDSTIQTNLAKAWYFIGVSKNTHKDWSTNPNTNHINSIALGLALYFMYLACQEEWRDLEPLYTVFEIAEKQSKEGLLTPNILKKLGEYDEFPILIDLNIVHEISAIYNTHCNPDWTSQLIEDPAELAQIQEIFTRVVPHIHLTRRNTALILNWHTHNHAKGFEHTQPAHFQ